MMHVTPSNHLFVKMIVVIFELIEIYVDINCCFVLFSGYDFRIFYRIFCGFYYVTDERLVSISDSCLDYLWT